MQENLQKILQSKRFIVYNNQGIQICTVPDSKAGTELLKEIVYAIVDQKTALYLSGGNTPKLFYQALAREEKLTPGVVGLIDERYGTPMHETSNEKMIGQTGLVKYLSILDIPYYTYLHGVSIEQTAERYDELYRSLNAVYRKSVGILGIGNDGHTAGIAPDRFDFQNRLFDSINRNEMVSWFDDTTGPFGKRVTLTFLGLTMLDFLIVLVFGEEKKRSLSELFEAGTEKDIPARFYKRIDIATKTLLITDQKV